MGGVKFCSFNARGLNSPSKRNQILNSFHKQKIDIVLFQETHFSSDHIPKIISRNYVTWIHDTFAYSKSKGVSIAFHRNIPHQILQNYKGGDGRSLIARVMLYGKIFTIINLYLPNYEQIKSGMEALSNAMEKAEGVIILGGDFNFILDTKMDTTSNHTHRNKSQLREFKNVLGNYQMIDIWRIQHETEKNYTYYSNIHDSYHRIDYFFINRAGIMMTPLTDIDGYLWSDHAPIYLELKLTEHKKNKKTRESWRMNDNLIKDKECENDIRKEIIEFSLTHEKDETSNPIPWEALKCVLRGLFIKHGSRLKKRKRTKESSNNDRN